VTHPIDPEGAQVVSVDLDLTPRKPEAEMSDDVRTEGTARDFEMSKIVELRRYALHPDGRETLIELFDREFVETQEAVGMHVLGQFRDLDDPDSFVWLRGFSDMRTRKRGLETF
jgi:hypothetical protein